MQAKKPVPAVKSLSCPNCGGSVQMRGMGRSLTVVCIQCLSVLDATSPSLNVVQEFRSKERFQPLIPLGTRGKMHGTAYDVIGFQVRELTADGVAYTWAEYLLFNPYKGFRYLTEYNGHWNDVTTIRSLPNTGKYGGRPSANYQGKLFKHFQHYDATTIFVMGEFPWKIRVGETVVCDDYIAPPRMLASEKTNHEVTWSLCEYTDGKTIWQNFGLKGNPPEAKGVFANQPGPVTEGIGKSWMRFLIWVSILIAVQVIFGAIHASKTVFSQRYSFTQQVGNAAENSFVTEIFELGGRTSNAEVTISTDLSNNWAFFNLALINAETGRALDFSRQVSYYSGRDSDGSWTEGKATDSVVLPSVEPGRYYLRVEPELDTSTPSVTPRSVRYQIKVVRDVTTWAYFFIGCLLLLIPPIWTSLRGGSCETRRWSESDYAGGGSSSGGGDDD